MLHVKVASEHPLERKFPRETTNSSCDAKGSRSDGRLEGKTTNASMSKALQSMTPQK